MASRPLQHPAIEDVTLTGILYALSDPTRLAIVRELYTGKCGINCSEIKNQIKVDMAKSTCSQHFQILRESGLIVSERQGVELKNRLRIAELEKRFPDLLNTILTSAACENKKKPTKRKTRKTA